MAKWADYLISHVKESDGIISRVVAHNDNDTNVSIGNVYTAADIIKSIQSGTTFCTIVWSYSDAKWSQGAHVGIETRNGKLYLRSHKDKTWNDNLEHLPPIHEA